jgi:hypothetical protein
MMQRKKEDRWAKLKAGLYDAIYGKGLEQPYLDSTARLLDELRNEHADLQRQLDALRDAAWHAVNVLGLEDSIERLRAALTGD